MLLFHKNEVQRNCRTIFRADHRSEAIFLCTFCKQPFFVHTTEAKGANLHDFLMSQNWNYMMIKFQGNW